MASVLPTASRTPRRRVMLPLSALARLRERTYRLIGGAFLYPDDRRLPSLAALARELRGDRASAARFAFYLPWSRCLEALANADADPVSLRSAYVRTFLIEPVGGPCVPQESAYRDEGVGGVIGELERRYAAAGLVVAAAGEPADHVAVELHFMAFLCGEEAAAWAADGHEAERCLEREREFLGEHPARWIGAFAEWLGRTPHAGIYRLVGEAASAFVQHDVDLLALLATTAPAGAS